MNAMKVYLLNKDNPAAQSMAKKLLNAPDVPGGMIACSNEEMAAYGSRDLIELQPKTQPMMTINDAVQLMEIDPNKAYIAICSRRKVSTSQLTKLHEAGNIRIIVTS